MKAKVLIKEDIAKEFDIVEKIKRNDYVENTSEMIVYYNNNTWYEVFEKAYMEFNRGDFQKFIIIDDYSFGPFLYISKQKGWVATSALDATTANLIRAHNNSKVCIIPMRLLNPKTDINGIITSFCISDFENGRHTTRLQILHACMVPTETPLSFSQQETKTVVIGSDHAGFALKTAISAHLTSKGYKVIDVGTNSLDSTHYSLYGPAIAAHYPEASYAIGVCWTGMGMANSLNKFKGVRACVCTNPENVKIAREKFGMNTLVLGSKFFDKPDNALAIVDMYLQTKPINDPVFSAVDKLGCSFNKEILKRLDIDPKIVIPKELQ